MAKIQPHTELFIKKFNEMKNNKQLPSNAELSVLLGMRSPNTLTEIKNKRQNIQFAQLQKFCDLYGLSMDEFMKGYKKKNSVEVVGKTAVKRLREDEFDEAYEEWEGLPVYNQTVSASFVEHYQDEAIYEPIYRLRDPRFKDCNFAAIITGDSMHDEIRHGDYVVCQEITDRSFIVYGDIYYIVANNGLETCKYVNADRQDDEQILLVPKNEKISPSPIRKDMVLKLYKVKGIIRGY